MQTIDLEPYQYSGTNITGVRIVDPEGPMMKLFTDFITQEENPKEAAEGEAEEGAGDEGVGDEEQGEEDEEEQTENEPEEAPLGMFCSIAVGTFNYSVYYFQLKIFKICAFKML